MSDESLKKNLPRFSSYANRKKFLLHVCKNYYYFFLNLKAAEKIVLSGEEQPDSDRVKKQMAVYLKLYFEEPISGRKKIYFNILN